MPPVGRTAAHRTQHDPVCLVPASMDTIKPRRIKHARFIFASGTVSSVFSVPKMAETSRLSYLVDLPAFAG
jgi:hypothetical protein